MSKISCHIRMGEIPLHLYHITSGFLLLQKNGIIDLKVEKINKYDNSSLPYNMMEVIINSKIRVLYDLNDGYDNLLPSNEEYSDFMNELLTRVDFYFKRSFSRIYNKKLKESHKIYPLGLNYMVTVPRNVSHFPTPNDPKREKIKKLIRLIPFTEFYNGKYNVDAFEDIPIRTNNPKILFMARLWDLEGDNKSGISLAKKEERTYINECRVKCIRLARKEFGDKFFGGVSPSKFSEQYYPDVVIHDKQITKRNNYIKIVKESSICIATMGLHESIGWKFAEYISASKAVVTEDLVYEVPGNFKVGQNYLVFKKPDECIEQIYKLMDNSKLRYQMMVNNFVYYHNYVRPDRLVLNSILTVLNNGGMELESDSNYIHANI